MSQVQTGCMSACAGFEELQESIEQRDQELATMRAAILALKAQLEKPMPGMGNGDIARRLDEIAG